MTIQFHVPAYMATLSQALPPCCARHGAPAAEWQTVVFESRPPLWVYLTLVFGFLPTLVILISMRRQLRAPYWPFCPQCLHLRRQRKRLAYVVSAAWFAACVVAGGVAAWADLEVVGVVTLLCATFGTPLLGAAFFSSAGWSSIADGFASRDGMSLVFPRPAPVFTSAVMARGVPGRW